MSTAGRASSSDRSDLAEFVGRGFAWPASVDHTGSMRLSSGPENIEHSIQVILSTAPGERVFRPEFGCEIWNQLFDPITPSTTGLMAHNVRQALLQWQPQIDVVSVDVEPDRSDSGRVQIHISYSIKSTNDRRNLVYPFYVIPREGDGA